MSSLFSFLFLAASSFTASAFPSSKAKRDTLPDFALTYAPYSHLYSGESWWPSDTSIHLQHVTPEVNYVPVGENATMETLDTFATDVYLTSNDNVETNPAWLTSDYGIPNNTGYSVAPATIIAAAKPGDIVDVFYFYFYSYNEGNT